MSSKRAFTLIELLIVVAIIAILTAIAVPNFLEAQTRAKVSRAKADIKALVTATEAYRVDASKYINAEDYTGSNNSGVSISPMLLTRLTTPVAYISVLPPLSPFGPWQSPNWPADWFANGYMYVGGTVFKGLPGLVPVEARGGEYLYLAMGPSRRYSTASVGGLILPYDPTNGTVSVGDLLYVGGSSGGWGSFR